MSFYAFDADDLAVGSSEVMISVGRRRFLLRNVSKEHLHVLQAAHKSGYLNSDSIPSNLLKALSGVGAVHSSVSPIKRAASVPAWNVLPSRLVQSICRPLTPLASRNGLLALLVISALGFATGICRPRHLASITTWASVASPLELLRIALVFSCIIVAHELGHAAACLHRLGLVGAISARLYMAVPVFTTDVSIVQRASPQDKAEIAIAGVVFQVAISAALLLCDSESVQMAATFSLMSAAFAIMPLPGSDGYWFICDYFNVELTSCFAANKRKDLLGWSYTIILAFATIYLFCVLLYAGWLIFSRGAQGFSGSAGAIVSILIGLYAWIIALLSVKRAFRFFVTGDPAIP